MPSALCQTGRLGIEFRCAKLAQSGLGVPRGGAHDRVDAIARSRVPETSRNARRTRGATTGITRADGPRAAMRQGVRFVVGALIGGALVVVPLYLAVLLLLKAMKSVAGLARPFAMLLPDWIPAERALSLLLVLVICFLIGVLIRTPAGRAAQERLERSFFERIPGYALIRSLSQRMAGQAEGNVWKPALAEIEDALVPAFIIEEFEDGRFTVFVPSVPTPLAGAVYVLAPERVHPLDIPFTQAAQSISRWGSGSKALVAAMRTGRSVE